MKKLILKGKEKNMFNVGKINIEIYVFYIYN